MRKEEKMQSDYHYLLYIFVPHTFTALNLCPSTCFRPAVLRSLILGISSICIPRSLFRNADSGAQRPILTSSLGEADAVKFENHCVWPSCGMNCVHHENGNAEAGKELRSKLEKEGVLPVWFLLTFSHCQIKTQRNSEMGASEHSISFFVV